MKIALASLLASKTLDSLVRIYNPRLTGFGFVIQLLSNNFNINKLLYLCKFNSMLSQLKLTAIDNPMHLSIAVAFKQLSKEDLN